MNALRLASVFVWFAGVAALALGSDLKPERLRCEYGFDPLGIDLAHPRLSWELTSNERGQRQTAWQVLVASSPEVLAQDRGDLWDSGRVESGETAQIPYAGQPLRSSQQVFWKLRAWDVHGETTPWTPAATWTMGVLSPEDWRAEWIVAPWTSEALRLRQEFDVGAGLKRALLHISGLGQYEVAFNGAKAGDDLLSPGWTNYDRTTLYDTRDATALVREGRNAIGVELGNGMYNVVRRNRFAKFTGSFGPLRVIAQLELEYADGKTVFVTTDETWRVARGPITYNSIYGGEDFDARLDERGWTKAGFDDRSWTRAVKWVRPPQTLRGYHAAAEPLRAIETIKPVAATRLKSGALLYDFGQNASFMPRLRVTGPAGSTVRLTPGEVAKEDGTIERGTMGGAHRGSAWWQYTKGTDGEETWFPKFYYVGSRYLQVDLQPAAPGGAMPEIAELEDVVVHSSAEPLGDFATSNPLLNRIRDLVRWAQRSNMVSILTDCPHREKLGWIEQYHLNGPSIRYEFDVARIFTKGLHDMAEAQTEDGLIPNIAPEYTQFKGAFRGAAEWGAAFILVPWQQYQFTGDTGLLAEHYPAMKRYFAYLESRAKNDILSDGLGDWYDYLMEKNGRAGLTPPPITATAYYFRDAEILSKIATILGKTDDARDYEQRAARIRHRYNREFFHPETGGYGTESQCSLALPLALGLVEPGRREAALELLVKDVEKRGYATAGDIGFRSLLRALADGGRSDVIYRMINQDEKPGYGYQIKHGATALTESWNASLGASHNHFMLGQVIEWFYHDLAGIQPDPAGPGFAKIVIAPQPVGDLAWVQASYHSIRGPISTRWERDGKTFVLDVSIPANTGATVVVPADEGTPILEGGLPAEKRPGVILVARQSGRATFRIGSGTYRFQSTK
ncbi:alpha-L-rhamnosidase [Opitutaceae bacterium EW11]|nr:alpha-L-rhamnosidase [Opitutaceae bacterium EW11]